MSDETKAGVLLYIDSIHCGGAQRQLCHLAIGLKNLGHDVAVAVYYPEYEFFKPLLRSHRVPLIELRRRRPWGMVRELGHAAASRQAAWVISFLEGPSIYALLTKLWYRNFKLCVAERSANTSGRFSLKQRVLRRLYVAADRITTNSHFQADILRRHYPRLSNRLATIRNCVGDEFFAAHRREGLPSAWNAEKDWLAVVGQIAPWKNLHGLIDAVLVYRRQCATPIRIRWAGRPAEAFGPYVDQQRRRIAEHQLGDQIELLGNVEDIPSFLAGSKGLLHPSTLEGFPNAVCEAFAVGLPAIIGDISDARILIGENRGLLFDPSSAESIAAALQRFVELPANRREQMGLAAHEYARKEFREEFMAEKYSELLSCERPGLPRSS